MKFVEIFFAMLMAMSMGCQTLHSSPRVSAPSVQAPQMDAAQKVDAEETCQQLDRAVSDCLVDGVATRAACLFLRVVKNEVCAQPIPQVVSWEFSLPRKSFISVGPNLVQVLTLYDEQGAFGIVWSAAVYSDDEEATEQQAQVLVSRIRERPAPTDAKTDVDSQN